MNHELGAHIEDIDEIVYYHAEVNPYDTDPVPSREVGRFERAVITVGALLIAAEIFGFPIVSQFSPDACKAAFDDDVQQALNGPKAVKVEGGQGPEPPSPAHPPGQGGEGDPDPTIYVDFWEPNTGTMLFADSWNCQGCATGVSIDLNPDGVLLSAGVGVNGGFDIGDRHYSFSAGVGRQKP